MSGERPIQEEQKFGQQELTLPPLPDTEDSYKPIDRERFAQLVGACTEAKSVGLQLLILRQLNGQRNRWVDIRKALEIAQHFDGNIDEETGEKGYLPGPARGIDFFRNFIEAHALERSNEEYRLVEANTLEITRLFALAGAMQEISDMFEPFGASDILGAINSVDIRLAVLRAIDDEYTYCDPAVKEISMAQIGQKAAKYLGRTFNSTREWSQFLDDTITYHVESLELSQALAVRRSDGRTGPSYKLNTQDISQLQLQDIGVGASELPKAVAEDICKVLAGHTQEFLYAAQVRDELFKLSGKKEDINIRSFTGRIGSFLSYLSRVRGSYVARREDRGVYMSHKQRKRIRETRMILDGLQEGNKDIIKKYFHVALQNITDTTGRQQRHYMQKGQERYGARPEEERKKEREQILTLILKKGGITIPEIVTQLQNLAGDKTTGVSKYNIHYVVMALRQAGRVTAIKRPHEQVLRLVFNFHNPENQQMLETLHPSLLRYVLQTESPAGQIVVNVKHILEVFSPEQATLPDEDIQPTRRSKPETTHEMNRQLLAKLDFLNAQFPTDELTELQQQGEREAAMRALIQNNKGKIINIVNSFSLPPGFSREDAINIASYALIHATETHDSSKGALFISYAEKRMQGSLRSAIRKHNERIHIPDYIYADMSTIRKVIQELAAESKQEVTIEDILAKLHSTARLTRHGKPFTPEKIRDVLEIMKQIADRPVESLDQEREWSGEERTTLGERVPAPPAGEEIITEKDLERLIDSLQPCLLNDGSVTDAAQTAKVIVLRYVEEWDIERIARQMGLIPSVVGKMIMSGVRILQMEENREYLERVLRARKDENE